MRMPMKIKTLPIPFIPLPVYNSSNVILYYNIYKEASNKEGKMDYIKVLEGLIAIDTTVPPGRKSNAPWGSVMACIVRWSIL